MTVEAFLKALFSGDAEKVEQALGLMLKVNLSYHDVKFTKGSKSAHALEDVDHDNHEEATQNPEKSTGKRTGNTKDPEPQPRKLEKIEPKLKNFLF